MPAIPSNAYALIIGAMKCGTTSLFSYLQGHPQICPARVKEPEFFSKRQAHRLPVERYEDLWDFDPSRHKYALEASTGYTKYPREQDVPKRMYEYGIRPKFIYCVRDPFERIESTFNFSAQRWGWRLKASDPQAVDFSNYYRQLEQYRPYFPREDMLVVSFEELKADPASVVESVSRFLGISDDYQPTQYSPQNVTTFDSRLEGRLRRSPVGGLLRRLPQPLRRTGRNALRELAVRKRRTLSKAERAQVHRTLAADMARLRDEYGVDVGKWGF